MSTSPPNRVGNPDKAGEGSGPQQGARNGDVDARRSRASLRSIATSVGGTTVVASEGAASPDGQKSSHVDYLEQARLASLQPAPEQSLVYNRRPPRPPPASSQRSPSSAPAPTQVPHWSALYHDGANGLDLSLRIPAEQENGSTPSAEAIDIVHDPSRSPKDITARVQLPLVRDFEDELEEFCRLRRFGCFQKAEEYFQGNLGKVSDVPYVVIQHAEALLAAGDFRGVSKVINQQSLEFGSLGDSRAAKKLAINLELLGLLSQPRFPPLAPRALSAASEGLPENLVARRMGSTEVQTLSLSLRVLQYIVDASSQTPTPQINSVREQARASCDWNVLYHELLGNSRIWDLRDLLTAMIPVFGYEDTFSLLLGMRSTEQALQVLVDDWIHAEYDEAATLGLLDAFSFLILQNVGDNSRTALLLHHSRSLVESIQQHNTKHMKTRPFIQFILAKAAVEMEKAWKERDVQGLSEPDGLLVSPGLGVNLPIFVPAKHLEKPGWESFYAQTPPPLRQAVNIALQAAKFTGDYALQATAWKLLILQSQVPRPMMEGLARLQLDVQDDKEGFLTTCLSKYLTTVDRGEEEDLLKELDQLDVASGGTYLTWGFNASLLWARSIIQGQLESSTQGPTDDISGAMQDPGKVCKDEIDAYGARLSERVVRFLDTAFSITAPRPLRVSFNGLQNREQAQAAKPAAPPQQQESRSPRPDLVQHGDDTSTEEVPRDIDIVVKSDNLLRSERNARVQQWASPPSEPPRTQRSENHFGVSRPPPSRERRTTVIIDHPNREDSSDDYDAGTQHGVDGTYTDGSDDNDIDVDVRQQYSEAKNTRQRFHQAGDSESDSYERMFQSSISGDSASEDGVKTNFDGPKTSTKATGLNMDALRSRMRRGSRNHPFGRSRDPVRVEPPNHDYTPRTWSMEREEELATIPRGINPFIPDGRPPYPSAFQGGYPPHVQGFPPPVISAFPPHTHTHPTHPGMMPQYYGGHQLPPWGFPPPHVYPLGYGPQPPPAPAPAPAPAPPPPPQQPGYFAVSGWPATWQQDAHRLLGPADPQPQPYAQPPPAPSQETDSLQDQGAYPPQGLIASADDGYRPDKLEAQHFVPLPPVAEERDSTVDTSAARAPEGNGETGGTQKAANNEDVEDDDDDEGYEGSPSRIQYGLPKLDFPQEILDDNTMTVLVRSKTDPQKGKVYNISKEGITETDVLKVVGHSHQNTEHPHQDAVNPRQDAVLPRQDAFHPRQDPGYPRLDAIHPRQDAVYLRQDPVYPRQETVYLRQDSVYLPQEPGYPHQEPVHPRQEATHPPQESSSVMRRTDSHGLKRRVSYRASSVSRPEPSTHGQLRAVPDAPPPPRADSFAVKSKEPNGNLEADGSKKTADKETTTEPEPRQHRRQHSISKVDTPKSSAKPGPSDRPPINGTFTSSPRRMHTKDQHITPAAASPSRAGTRHQHIPPAAASPSRVGTKDQRVPRVRERPPADKPAPEQETYSPAAASPSRAGTKDQRVPRKRERPPADRPAPEQETKNKNQAYAETDGESDARPESPTVVVLETKVVPPDKQQDEEDRLSVTAQRSGSDKGEGGGKAIARARTWN